MNWFDKYMPAIIFAGLLAFAGMTGYYCGMYRAVTDVKTAVYDGLVVLELNGQIYEHMAEGWEM